MQTTMRVRIRVQARPRLLRLVALGGVLATLVTLAACGGGAAGSGDTSSGIPAPATVITPDNPGAPDSTSGISPQRTGAPGAAGTRVTTDGDSGIRSTSPASSTPGIGGRPPAPRRP